MKKHERLFVGRKRELSLLNKLLERRAASLAVIKGRRRIGKSRLIEQFSKNLSTLTFLGLAPEEKITAHDQRTHFCNQLERQLGLGGLRSDDWDHILSHLAAHTKTGRHLIVFDEINWMGSKDPTFLPKLKTAWDTLFSKNPEIIFILSGSVAGWIEKNILTSTGFLGRIALDMTLEELSINECSEFWGPNHHLISPFEKFKVLSVTGGVPLYLEALLPNLTAEDNIKNLCFQKEGMLFNEFDRIFTDLFARRQATLKKIALELSKGPLSLDQILKNLDHTPTGVFSEYLDDLVKTGYISHDTTWDLKTGKTKGIARYRLKDNYLRFALRYIEPKKEVIARLGQIPTPSWSSVMGLQFENLVLNNRKSLYTILEIDSADIVYDNPYLQTKTKSREGCQIDLLIQTRFNTLYFCEIKFSKQPLSSTVIDEVKEKIKTLTLPRGFSVRPVLIHVNGIDEAVEELGFFAHTVDFSDFI